jgi:GNAT superfamily N-acetyltransferase
VEIRPATEADFEAEFHVFVAAMHELHTRRGGEWPTTSFDPAGRWTAVHRHLLTHDGDRSFVAEEANRVIGFTAAFVRGDSWFFSALFVHPEHQGKGVGRRLFDHALDGDYRRRLTITEAIQPVSNMLYASRGLLPVAPVLDMTGIPRIEHVDGLEAATPDADVLRVLDVAAYGFDRHVDHEFWARTCSRATVWRWHNEPVAYSYVSPFGVGPVAGRDATSAAQALQAELARCAGEEIDVSIPGTAGPLVDVALRAGLCFTDPGLLLLSPADEKPPSALALHSYWLM